MTIVFAHDATGQNEPHLPPGQAAGYSTGSGPVPWTAAQFARHPGAVRIAQSPVLAVDEGVDADVLDVENGTIGNAEAAAWYRSAVAAYNSGARPGQRLPAIYTSASNVTPLVNQLITDGVTAGPRLWIANWNDAVAADIAAVNAASGPYPVIGFQFINGAFYDSDVFSASWLTEVSGPKPSGPYRHVLVNRSLLEVANARHTTYKHLLSVTASAYTAHDATAIIDGMIIYTTNP